VSATPAADPRAEGAGDAGSPAPGQAADGATASPRATGSRSRAFRGLEGLSITHSLIYLGLIAMWLTEGPGEIRRALGWAHGILWIVMSLLIVIAARKAIVSFRLAVLVAVVGGLGPFAGTLGFLWEGRDSSGGSDPSHFDHDAAAAER
jgi:hypothetical protein